MGKALNGSELLGNLDSGLHAGHGHPDPRRLASGGNGRGAQ